MKQYLVFAALFFSTTLSATSHTIRFGGGFGNVYEPKTLSVAVGDTVIWRGDFSIHPLSSSDIPNGAPSFNHSGDPGITGFKYVVEFAGSYTYKCDVHGSAGMMGTFTAIPAAVGDPKAIDDEVQAVVGKTDVKVRLGLASPSRVSARLLDHLGRTVSELPMTSYPAGDSGLTMSTHEVISGPYFLDVRINDRPFIRRLAVIK